MDRPNEQSPKSYPGAMLPHATDARACVILVPFATHIAPACEEGLIELQRRGYEVWRVGGYAAIDQGRNQLATDALAAGRQYVPDAVLVADLAGNSNSSAPDTTRDAGIRALEMVLAESGR